MKNKKIIYTICGITSAFSLVSYQTPHQTLLIANTPSPSAMQNNQPLLNALTLIGVPMEDLSDFKVNGTLSTSLVKAFKTYAMDSSNGTYDTLSQEASNQLVLFGFFLKSQNKITQETMQTLMNAEKARVGMSSQDVKTLNTLNQNIQNDSSYDLTSNDVSFIKGILPFINQNPFAFADTIGPLISAFVLEDENNPNVDDDIEQTLTNAAQDLSQLSDEQVQNITNITQNYQTTEEFTPTQENVSDINQALALSLIPLGAFALYPLLGSENVYEVNNITRNYDGDFDRNYVDHWNGEVNRNRNAEQARANRQNAGDRRGQGNIREGAPGDRNGTRAGAQAGSGRRNNLDRSRGGGLSRGDRGRATGHGGGGAGRAGGGRAGGGHGGGGRR